MSLVLPAVCLLPADEILSQTLIFDASAEFFKWKSYLQTSSIYVGNFILIAKYLFTIKVSPGGVWASSELEN